MFSRILFSTIAASFLAAAPALAAEPASTQQCSCCSDGSVHDIDHPLREKAAAKEKAAPKQKAVSTQPRPAEDDPNVRNQSWGG